MLWFRRAGGSSPRRHRSLRRPTLEPLEGRALLAAQAAAPVFDFGPLAIDPAAFDPESILVRFRENAPHPAAGAPRGIKTESLAPWLPGLQRVKLPRGSGVEAALAAFRSDPHVLYAEPDYRVHATQAPNDPRFGELWGMENSTQTGGTNDADIDAAGAWDVNTGSGAAVVAVIDTGVDTTHSDLAANLWVNPGEIPGDGIDNDANGYVDDVHGYDFLNRDGDPRDDNGHGTHVAGTIGAVGNNGIGVAGVNWNVQIMALKFLGADGSGSTSDAIEAVAYAVANGAQVSNNSWGGDPYSQAMFDVIAAARNAGHLFVAAAGNGNAFGIGLNNDATPFYPAGYELDNIVAVAAVDHNDNLATFSNYGAATVDLAAPGVNILSTTPGGGYGQSSGTSMAAPHVAGVAALTWDAHPTWSYSQVVDQLLATVDPLPSLQGVTVAGGRLNAAAALGNPQPPPPPPPPGSLPLFEDFQDGVANYFDRQSGAWSVGGGRYHVTPSADNDDLPAISTLRLDAPPPDDVEIEATLNADEGRLEVFGIVLRDYLTNAFLVFDYHGLDDFKFAGADMDGDRWVIGRRDAAGWAIDASVSQALQAGTNYQARLEIEQGNRATLFANGAQVLVHTFSETVTEGLLGVGARNSSSHVDNVLAQPLSRPTPGALPLWEDFNDGAAEHLQRRTGMTAVNEGEYHVTPLPGGDGVSTLVLNEELPANLEIQASFNADPASTGRYSNAVLIFDYHGPTNFKFAGAYVGGDQWVIGHRIASGWALDAAVSAPIEALTDYDLRVTIESSGVVTLFADGVKRAAHQFAETLTDGDAGLGTQNALSRFDNLAVQEFVPPPSATLPHAENFDDGEADLFDARSGDWTVAGGRYHATPAQDGDGVATLRLNAIPANLEVAAVFNSDGASADRLSNAFLIFDYRGPLDFKFAGAHVGGDQWVIGYRSSSGWITTATKNATIDALTDYRLRLTLDADRRATLYAGGVQQVSYAFGDPLTDGAIGVGARDAIARFDDFAAQELVPPPQATLPHADNFDDGVADFFQPRSGVWSVTGGRYGVTPAANSDGVSTLTLNTLPANLEIAAVVNADDASSGRFSNAFLIFDYQSPTNFKFAGTYVGGDQWLIGRRTTAGWITDAAVSAVINPQTDYHLRVTLDSNRTATLYADGVQRISRQFSDTLTDGAIGLGTSNALSRFDNLTVHSFTPTQASSLFASADLDEDLSVPMETGLLTRRAWAAPPSNGREPKPTLPTPPFQPRQASPAHAPPGDAHRFDETFAQLAHRRDEWDLDLWARPQDDLLLGR